MFDYLLKLYGLKNCEKKLITRLISTIVILSLFYSIIQIVVIIQFEDKLNVTFLKVTLCLAAVSSLASYIYSLYKSNELSILSDSLKNLENDTFLDKSNNYSAIFALIVILSATLSSFIFRENYPHMREVYEESIIKNEFKEFIEYNSTMSLILNNVFNYGWKIMLQLIYYNINKQYLSILISFNDQLSKRKGVPTINVIDFTHRTIDTLIRFNRNMKKNLYFIKSFIRLDIVIFFLCQSATCVNSLSNIDLSFWVFFLIFVSVIYSYYSYYQLISCKIEYNESTIKECINNWGQLITDEMARIHWMALQRSLNQHLNINETYF
jgi:hypothetical protein